MTSREYEVRVAGPVPEAELAELPGLVVEVEPPETVLCGPVAGPAELEQLLARLQDLGLEVLEVRRLPGGQEP